MAKFVVTFTLEVQDATNEDVREYVDEAVSVWGGQRHPEDPFFGDNKTVSAVKVTRYRKQKKAKKT